MINKVVSDHCEDVKVSKARKYLRLLRVIVAFGLFSALCGFVILFIWDYGFSLPVLTREQVYARAVYALRQGMLVGLVIGVAEWLVMPHITEASKQ